MFVTKMAFKYRAYPTSQQRRFLDETIKSCWWFYRYVLHHYEDDYRVAKRNFFDSIGCWYSESAAYHPYWYHVDAKPKVPKECYPLGAPIRHQGFGEYSTYKLLQKARRERKHLNTIPAIVMQEVLERVAHAFDKFWKEGGGYPRYPKLRDYRSVTWTQNVSLDEPTGKLSLSRFPGELSIRYHRPIRGTIKRANVSRDILGQYYVSLMCESNDISEIVKENPRIVGIDMNIGAIDEMSRSFIALSNGTEIDIPRWYTQGQKHMKYLQRKVSACTMGSDDWYRYSRRVKHHFETMGNRKANWLHTITNGLRETYDYVIIEDLTLTGFHKKRKKPELGTDMQLAADRGRRKAWNEAPHGELKRQLAYKFGNRLFRVPPANTSKRCSHCKVINTELTVGIEEWTCSNCGTHHDRQINAAINIYNDGLALINDLIKKQQEKVV